MKRLILLSLLVLCAVPAVASIANGGFVHCEASSSGCTTSGVNTTGATLITFLQGAKDNGANFTAPADSKSNTWTCLTLRKGVSAFEQQLCYAVNPVVGSGHTFTCAGTQQFPICMIQWWTGTDTTAGVYDTGTDQGLQQQAGLYINLPYGAQNTPTCNGELILSGWGTNANFSGLAIDSGLTILDQTTGATGDPGAIAYLINSVAFPIAPTWTLTSGNSYAANIAAFKPATCVAVPHPSMYPYVPAVQSRETTSGATLNACPFYQNVTSGDLLCYTATWATGTGSVSVTDILGTSFTQELLYNCTGANTCVGSSLGLYCGFAPSSGADTITLTQTSATNYTSGCMEFPPNWTLTADDSQARPYDLGFLSLTSGNVPSPSMAPAHNGDLAIQMLSGISGATTILPVTAGWYPFVFSKASGVSAIMAEFLPNGIAGNPGITWNSAPATGSPAGIVGGVVLQSSSSITFTTPGTAPDGITSTAYSWTPTVTGGVDYYIWSVSAGSLPTGLSVNSSTGEIHGTPSAPCTCSFTLQVTDGTHTQTQAVSLKVGTSFNSIALLESVPCNTSSLSGGCGSLSFSGSVTPGQLLIVSGGYGGNTGTVINFGPLSYCTDSRGTVFRVVTLSDFGVVNAGEVSSSAVLLGFATSSGADTITCTADWNVGSISRWSGVTYAEGDNVNINRNTEVSSPANVNGSLTTLVPNELIYINGMCFDFGCTLVPQSPLTTLANATIEQQAAYLAATTATVYSLPYTMTDSASKSWFMQSFGLRPSAGGSTSSAAPRHRGSFF